MRLDPRDESHLLTLGELYWVRGKKDRADEIWRRLLTLSPSRALGQARLADVYAEHNLMNEAQELYQKAVKAEPNNLQIKRGLAQSLERLNRPKDAVAVWGADLFRRQRARRSSAAPGIATAPGQAVAQRDAPLADAVQLAATAGGAAESARARADAAG